jgi:hypothetical protein
MLYLYVATQKTAMFSRVKVNAHIFNKGNGFAYGFYLALLQKSYRDLSMVQDEFNGIFSCIVLQLM